MFHNGWEYYIINPFSKDITQKTQEMYLLNYNESYCKMINDLLIPDPLELFDKNTDTDTFIYYTDCSGDMDIINNDTEYEYKFLKHKFFEKKTNKNSGISSHLLYILYVL